MKKILCFGEALVDLLSNTLEDHHATQETFSKFAGGAPANVSVVAAKLGGNAFVGGLLYQLGQLDLTQQSLAALCQQPHKLSPIIEFASLCGAHAASRKGAFISLPSQQSLAEFRSLL